MHGTIKVRKWGNSIGIIIPKFVADEMHIRVGSRLRMTYYENNLKLTTGPTDQERMQSYLAKILIENELMIERSLQDEDTTVILEP